MLLFYQKFSGNKFFTQNKDFSYFFTRTTSFLLVSYCIFIQYIEFSSFINSLTILKWYFIYYINFHET